MDLGSVCKGKCIIEVSGNNINRLINICNVNNILYKLSYMNSCIQFCITYSDKDKFLEYIKKLDLNYKILKERGIPILYFKYKVRYWVLLFLVSTILLLYKFSLYIWKIEIVGTSKYTSEEILEYVCTRLSPIGTKKSTIDCNELEAKLREYYTDLGWINCSIDGTKLTVEVLETIPPNYVEDNKTACNIISTKNAVIYDTIVTNGYLVAEKGMEVKKGDVLITGIMPIYNDYGEEQGTRCCPANGNVFGIVSYDYEDTIDINETIQIPVKSKSRYSIEIGKLSFEFPNKQSDNTITEYKQLKIGKTYYLPITVCKRTNIKYKENVVHLTEENAKAMANDNLQKYMMELRKKGVEIIQNNVKIHIENDRCIAIGQIICIEKIGIAVPIDCEDQGED